MAIDDRSRLDSATDADNSLETAGTELEPTSPPSVVRHGEDGGVGNCCTEKCVEALAAVECRNVCSGSSTQGPYNGTFSEGQEQELLGHEHQHDVAGQHSNMACPNHLRRAFAMYATYLEQARCICQRVLSTQQFYTGCSSQSQAVNGDIGVSTSQSFQDDDRGLRACRTPCTFFEDANGPLESSCPKGRESKTCCSSSGNNGSLVKGNNLLMDEPSDKDCCGAQDVKVIGDRKAENCYFDDTENLSFVATRAAIGTIDVEKAGNSEHVLVNVSGMDCSGCANKLERALKSVASISNACVTFITNTAEFDVNLDVSNVNEAVRHAERATGYKLSRFDADTQHLDIVVSSKEFQRLRDNMPKGILNGEQVSKDVLEVSYDPCIIGARDVLKVFPGGELAPPRDQGPLLTGRKRLRRTFWSTLIASSLSLPVVVLAWADTPVPKRTTLCIQLVLATFIQLLAYPEFYQPAFSALILNHVLEMDMLVVISITAAYCYSVVAFGFAISGTTLEIESFFETSSLLIALVLLGRLVAAYARKQAVAAVSMRSLQAQTAILMSDTGEATKIDARLLQFGDVILIPSHSQVVTDGNVLEGRSEVDESMLTGESLPVPKAQGSAVVAGTMNTSGSLKVRITRLPGRNTITDIATLVNDAQKSKPRIQDLADKIASYFIPVVVVAAIIVAVVWAIVALRGRQESSPSAAGTAISYGIAVLAVSCPCALGLAVPMVLVVAGGLASRLGVIIKEADVVERGHKVTDVVFDKTGTLTDERLEIVEMHVVDHPNIQYGTALSLTKALTRNNQHAVSRAVALSLEAQTYQDAEIKNLQAIPGAGIEAEWNETIVRAGHPYWLQVDRHAKVEQLISSGLTVLCISVGPQLVAVFGLKGILRPEAREVVTELQRRKIKIHIVSGDAQKVVENVADDLHIPLENIAARSTPSQKQEYVRGLMEQDRVALFCGDGTNDAAAVAQANVGVHVESSSDVTRAAADVVLLGSLDGILVLLDISKKAFRRISFNFAWAAVYNVLAILLAGGAFVKVRIPPAYAGLGEIVSVLPVIIAALTLTRTKIGVPKS